MHRDYLRSAVYSSLIKPAPVSCHTGKEATQCGTTRRSRAPPLDGMNPIVGERRGCHCLDPMLIGTVVGEEPMVSRENSELQLSQVSRGAQKLTTMIESLTKAPNLDGRSKYIAEDVLRSALDLQESLVMLGKLQEASKLMSEKRRKPKLELREEREEKERGFGVESMGSWNFEIGGRFDKLQEPRLSVDGSSRNSIEELKRVIRDSLHQQHLLSNTSDEEKGCLNRSVNFSQSCRFDDRSYERVKAMCSVTAAEKPKKAKSPNLIAKLMGLGDDSSGVVQPVRKEKEMKKSCNPVKLPLIEQDSDRKQKSLQEIMETMQFKGLLKKGPVEGRKNWSHFSDTSQSEQFGRNNVDDNVPPIVIMKPLHPPCWERGEVRKEHLGKVTVQEEIHSVNLVKEKKVHVHELVLPKTSEIKKVKKMEKTKVESLTKSSTLSTEFHKQHEKDATGTWKKTSSTQKPSLYGKKLEEKKDVKAARAPISPAKTTFAQQAKTDKRQSAVKNDVPKQSSTPPDLNLRCHVKPISRNSIGSVEVKNTSAAKPVRKSTPTKNNNKKLEDGKISDPICATDCVSTMSTLPADDLPKQSEQEDISCYKDGIRKDKKIFFEVMPKASQCGKNPELAEEFVQLMAKRTTIREPSGIEDDIKQLLQSSQTFLSLAQEFFGLDAHQPLHYRRKGLDEVVKKNAKLFLDCGKELLARKNDQRNLLNHPMLKAHMWDRTVCSSLDQLMEEISNGIEELVSYIVVDGDNTSKDSLCIRLERDLGSKEMLTNVMWDIGWRCRICVEESDQVICEVEEHLSSLLIDEIVADLVY